MEEENDLLESELKGKVSALKSVSKIQLILLINMLGMEYYERDCCKKAVLNHFHFSFLVLGLLGFIFFNLTSRGRGGGGVAYDKFHFLRF